MRPSLVLLPLVSAQTEGCESSTFEPCKRIANEYLELTCKPLLQSNQSHYNDCACINAVNLKNCYDLCKSSAALQELSNTVTPSVINLCKVAGIDPYGKLPPASWILPPPGTQSAASPSATAKSGELSFNSAGAVLKIAYMILTF